MILLPPHPCLPDAGGAVPYGELDARNVATCRERVRWGIQRYQDERLPGCGARIAVCHGCGLRTRVNGAPCGACGGEEKPEVTHAVRRNDDSRGHAPGEEAGMVDDDKRATVAEMACLSGEGARRETKEKAPSKPRAPRKTVKKGAAAPDDPGLPLFK